MWDELEEKCMRMSAFVRRYQVFYFPDHPRKKIPAEFRIPGMPNFFGEVQSSISSQTQAVQDFAPTYTGERHIAT
jgi:hypothetical protein